jgi:ammonia channel protein AmtB
MAAITSATDAASARTATMIDAYTFVLAMFTGEAWQTSQIASQYNADEIHGFYGAVTGVILGIITRLSPVLQKKIAASLRYGITGDEKHLAEARQGEPPMPGQYL